MFGYINVTSSYSVYWANLILWTIFIHVKYADVVDRSFHHLYITHTSQQYGRSIHRVYHCANFCGKVGML